MAERLDDLAATFRRALEAEGKSPRTIALSGQSVTYFGRWLVAQGRTETLDELTS